VLGAGLAIAIAAVAIGCADSGPRACVDGADCASGLCRADGTCAPLDDGGSGDADPAAPDGAPATCTPDHDGVVARDEILLAAGRQATFRVALDAAVDTAGALQGDGSRHWDFATAATGDQDVDVVLEPVGGAWWASTFPGASYAVRLSQRQDLLGVFEITGDALLLRGVVSPEAGIGRTELSYDPPVRVLAFPLAADDTWSDTATVSGLASGVAAYYSEAYDSDVDAVGEVATPYGTFPVLRVRVELTRTVGVTVVTSRQFLFVSECYGTVAAVTSSDYETQVEFDQAAELRRLAP